MIIPKMDVTRAENNVKFIKAIAPLISASNKDGLGYAAVNSSGELYGERWLVNHKAFTPIIPKRSISNLFPGLTTGSAEDVEYNKFGNSTLEEAASITLHTRYATSAKGFSNTHPFVDKDTSLIHNGVIDNYTDWKLKSTNDSEAILRAYLQHDVGNNFSNAGGMLSDLIGYYVAAVYSRDSEGKRILDIFKGNNNALFGAWVDELNTYVLSSSGTDITTACQQLGFTCGEITGFKDGIAMRLDIDTGLMEDYFEFKPNARATAKPVTTMWSVPSSNKPQSNHVTKNMQNYLKLSPKVEKLSSSYMAGGLW